MAFSGFQDVLDGTFLGLCFPHVYVILEVGASPFKWKARLICSLGEQSWVAAWLTD